jgi:hypothetical protein
MSLFVDQSEINSVLWKACDTFRGVRRRGRALLGSLLALLLVSGPCNP